MRAIKYILSIIPIIVAFLLIDSCKNDDQTRIQATWTSKDPIAIPQNIRFNQKKLGNLVTNNSFETGKIFYEQSDIKTFDINGWKKVGENIEWVNSTLENFESEEVFNGIHSVKIHRKVSDEIEEWGDGIMSDFIKVIPGNYKLKLQLKLKDIIPNQTRLGAKMYDAINIRLIYFDKNKIEINGVEFNPFTNNKIDNTFKSLSFANYRNIKDFGWGEVYGVTSDFPFYDGDMEDNARYVKIFIGLKGTGTMWIDDVEFTYTNNNFTLLERIKPYFDSSFSTMDLIFPTPKEITGLNEIVYFNKNKKELPVIVLANKKDLFQQTYANEIKQFFFNTIKKSNESIKIDDIQIVDRSKLKHLDTSSFAIILGNKESELIDNDSIVWHNQSYYIGKFKNQANWITLIGNRSEDLSYAVKTLLQMIDIESNIIYSARIYDYPDISIRNYLVSSFLGTEEDIKEKLKTFSEYKYNYPYFQYYNDNELFYPQVNIDEIIKSKARYIDANITDVNLNVKPSEITLIRENDTLNKVLKNISRIEFKENVEYLSAYSNLAAINNNEIDAAIFYNTVINQFNNLKLAWTGPDEISVKIDDAHCYRIHEIVKQNPIFIDNSLEIPDKRLNSDYLKDYYAGKIRLGSLFGPYENNFSNKLSSDPHSKVILNVNNLTELNTIRMLTAIDFYWNANDYNPDKSLWIVLNRLYGKENAKNLIYLNDAYYGLLEICRKMKVDGGHFKTLRMAKNFKTDLDKYWDLVEKGIDNEDLINELYDLLEVTEFDYNKIIKENK